MKYVFMNQRIHDKNPDGPVIVCQEDGKQIEGNVMALKVGGTLIGMVIFEPAGLEECETHEVKAWLELHDAVEVLPVDFAIWPKAEAKAKLPNRKVKT